MGRVLKLEVNGVWWMRGRDGAWRVWNYDTGDWRVSGQGPPAQNVPANFVVEEQGPNHTDHEHAPTYWRDAKLRIITLALAGLAVIAFVDGEPELGFIAAALSPISLILSIRHLRTDSVVTAGFVGVLVISGYYWWFHADSGFRWRVGIMFALAAGSWLLRDLPALDSAPNTAPMGPPPQSLPSLPSATKVRTLETVPSPYRWASVAAVFLAMSVGSLLTFSSDAVIEGVAVAGMTAGCSYYLVSRKAHIVAVVSMLVGAGTTGAVWFLSMFMMLGTSKGPSGPDVLGGMLIFSAIFYSLINLVVLVFTSTKRTGLGFALWPHRSKLAAASRTRAHLEVNFSSTRSTPPSE